MNLILYDDPSVHKSLYPLTFTRPVSSLRTGILTLGEKWARSLNGEVSNLTVPFLQNGFAASIQNDNWLIQSNILPDENLVNAIKKMSPLSVLVNDSGWLAARIDKAGVATLKESSIPQGLKSTYFRSPVKIISRPWDLFLNNHIEIIQDFQRITSGRSSCQLPDPFTRIYNERNIFFEEGVNIKAAILNAEEGPIYIGKNATIQEGVAVHGPSAILEGAVISMGAKIREDNTIGPYCKVGGEVKNSILFGNSNKAHEGYLGNSVIGEWCNLGAGTNNSNLKNNYSNVRVWDYEQMKYTDSGQQFCGVFMGDHSKTAIGTRINTGTVIGVSANVFGQGLTPKFIPSFSWGGYEKGSVYDTEKAGEAALKMMSRRNQKFNSTDKEIFYAIYKLTEPYREIRNK